MHSHIHKLDEIKFTDQTDKLIATIKKEKIVTNIQKIQNVYTILAS